MVAQIRADLMDFVVSNYLFGDVSRTPREDESLMESGIIDSTGILELIEFVESHFEIQLTEAETIPDNLGSVANLTHFVADKSSVRPPSV